MKEFLQGAHNMDTHFFETPHRTNLPILLALIGVWNSSFLKYNTRAILPYCQALNRFPAHIQQVDMESNGKRVTQDGTLCSYPTGEIIFGEPGTNGQHSFYQLIHQSNQVIPCEFIGFIHSQTPIYDTATEVISNHDELMCNFFAQPDALAYGKSIAELTQENVPPALLPHKEFPGNKPSTILLFNQLNAYTCGQLLSLYENRIAVQGFIWDINSFDQWGVELGKVLANKVRNTFIECNNKDINQEVDGTAAITPLLNTYNPSTKSLLKYYIQEKQSNSKK